MLQKRIQYHIVGLIANLQVAAGYQRAVDLTLLCAFSAVYMLAVYAVICLYRVLKKKKQQHFEVVR